MQPVSALGPDLPLLKVFPECEGSVPIHTQSGGIPKRHRRVGILGDSRHAVERVSRDAKITHLT